MSPSPSCRHDGLGVCLLVITAHGRQPIAWDAGRIMGRRTRAPTHRHDRRAVCYLAATSLSGTVTTSTQFGPSPVA